jgi:hypothetical protein
MDRRIAPMRRVGGSVDRVLVQMGVLMKRSQLALLVAPCSPADGKSEWTRR